MSESKLTFDDDGWPELACPVDGSAMGWLGGCFWLCYECKTHQIYGGVIGWIQREPVSAQPKAQGSGE